MLQPIASHLDSERTSVAFLKQSTRLRPRGVVSRTKFHQAPSLPGDGTGRVFGTLRMRQRLRESALLCIFAANDIPLIVVGHGNDNDFETGHCMCFEQSGRLSQERAVELMTTAIYHKVRWGSTLPAPRG